MNANRMIDMIVRQVMRRLVNKGVDKGFDMASRIGRNSADAPGAKDDSGAERHMQQNAQR